MRNCLRTFKSSSCAWAPTWPRSWKAGFANLLKGKEKRSGQKKLAKKLTKLLEPP